MQILRTAWAAGTMCCVSRELREITALHAIPIPDRVPTNSEGGALTHPDAFRNGSGDVWGTNFNVLFLSHVSSLAVDVPVPDTRWLDIPLRLIFQREPLCWHQLRLSVFWALSEDSLVARRRTQASATAPKGKTEAPRLGSGPVIMSIKFALTRLLKKQAARQPMSMKY
jgi:hypothetical protein